MALPPSDYTAPVQQPAWSGLYAVATIDPDTRRAAAGVHVWPTNCGPSGTWPSDVCAPPPTGTLKEGDRAAASAVFLPVTAWGYDECGLVATPDQSARATQYLAINEHLYVESAFATRLLADAGIVAASVNLWDAVAQLEAALAADGLVGVIHASTYWTTIALGIGLISKQGTVYRTARGTLWADGGGYDGVLGDTLVATGAVFLWRDPITVTEAISQTANMRVAVAERTVLVAYEPCHVSAVAVPDLIAGGGGTGGGGTGGILYPSA